MHQYAKLEHETDKMLEKMTVFSNFVAACKTETETRQDMQIKFKTDNDDNSKITILCQFHSLYCLMGHEDFMILFK